MAGSQLGAAGRQLQRLFSRGVDAGTTDDLLVRRFVAAHDESAFEALVERHGPMVLSVCHGVLRNRDDAQDAFQATFLILARKVGALQVGPSLAGWLYRVSYNTAVQMNSDAARRREMERRAATGVDPGEAASPDQVPTLYEELDRLPEKLRLPIVLCHLEELTHAQAAERLGWSVGAVRGRVARARALLRSRLARRGFAMSSAALVSLLGERAAKAAVPAGWIRATVDTASAVVLGQVATAGTVSTALQLAERGIRQMNATRMMRNLAVLATAGGTLGATGLVALALGHLDPGGTDKPAAGATPGPAASRPVDPSTARANPPAAADPGALPLGGLVLDVEGRPIAGASVRLEYRPAAEGPPAEIRAVAGPEGRFELRVPRAAFGGPGGDPPAVAPMVHVSARGFGPSSVPCAPGLTIRLVKDDIPLEGRVLDLEGRPVAGASVRTTAVYQSPTGDLSAWLKDARERGTRGPWLGLQGFPLELTATTGPDGRFRLDGIGRERIAELTISGPGIATARIHAMTRQGPDVVAEDRNTLEAKPFIYRAARFEHAAAPTSPVVGTVRDQSNGRPLAGVRVVGLVPSRGGVLDQRQGIEATTDPAGRFRLVGLATADAYRVFVYPGKGQPYPNVQKEVAGDRPGPGEVTCNVSLKPAVLVRGRLTDKATGRPVAGRVMSFSFVDNPRVDDYPGFAGTEPPSAPVGADGRFEVVALPGRGLIVAGTASRKYFPGAGSRAIAGLVEQPGSPAGGYFPTLPSRCSTSSFQAFAEINPGPDEVSVTCDLQLDPGRTVKATAVDPDGRPVTGITTGGLVAGASWDESPRPTAEFPVIGVPPDGTRRVYVFQRERKLAGSVLIHGDDPGPVVVKLQPWGVITGRIVADEERAPAKLEILGNYRPESPPADYAVFPADIPIGADGRFRIEGVVPGLQYEGRVADRPRIIGSAFRGVRVAPGETRDLGDCKPRL